MSLSPLKPSFSGAISALTGAGTGVLSTLAINVGSAGAIVVLNGALGTPSGGTLTNATGLPISSGVSGLGANVATFLATPSSANFAAAVTGETGTGGVVFSDSPLLTTLLTIDRNAIGTTTASGFVLENTTAAANGAQQNSPSLALIGNGWATGGGSSSTVQFRFDVVPVQGSSAPTGALTFRTKVGASAESTRMTLADNGVLTLSGNVASTTSTTGTLVITGGLGVSAACNFGSTLAVTGAVSSSSNFTAGTTNGFIGQGSSSMYVNGTAGLWIFDTSSFAGNAALLCLGTATNSSPCIGRELINSVRFQSGARTDTWNDASTANSGTAANRYCVGVNAPTFTSTGTSVTDTVASTLYIGGAPTASTNTTIGTAWAFNVAGGNVNIAGIAVHGAQVRLKGYTVATLPAGTQGDTAFVTDALTPTFLTAAVGGGAVVTTVFYNGAAWVTQ